MLCELLRNLRQLAAADVLAEGMAGLFLKHTLRVPLRVTGALRHFSSDQGDSRLSSIHDKILWIVMASLLRLDIILPLLILRQDLLEQLLKHGDFVRRQIFVNSWCNCLTQPDDTVAKRLRRPASTAPARRACQRGWVTVQSSLCTPGGRACASSPGSTESTVFSSTGVIHTSQRMEQSTRNWVAVISSR